MKPLFSWWRCEGKWKRSWLLALLLSNAGGLCTSGFGADGIGSPSVGELKALFAVVAEELPPKMVLAAEIEILEPPMDPEELERLIAEDVKYSMDAERRLAEKAGGTIPESDLESLREVIELDRRKRHSGKRRLRRKEWYSHSGKLYRNDWFDFLSLELHPEIETNIMSGRIPTHHSEISLSKPGVVSDSRFPEGSGISIDHGLQSASVHKAGSFKVDEPELWPVLSLEGELAFPLGVLLAEEGSIPEDPPFRDMIAGAKLDEKKLAQAAQGEVLGWKISAANESLDGQAATRISMVGQPRSMFTQILGALIEKTANVEIKEDLADAAAAEYSYWIGTKETSTEPRLLKAEKRVAGRFVLSSTREWDESTGLIRRWVKLKQDLKTGDETRTSYTFDEVNLNATYSDEDVFGYGQLDNFEFIDYDRRLVQFPEGSRIIELENSVETFPDWAKKTILFVIVLIPVLFIRKVLGLSQPKGGT